MVCRLNLGLAVVLAGVTMAGASYAAEPAPTTAEDAALRPAPVASAEAPSVPGLASQEHASGVLVQARVQAQSSLYSVAGGPGFLFGYQGPSYAVGLGLGLTHIGLNSGGQSGSLTLIQVAPTAIIDVWRSADGRARANVIASAGYARASLSATVSATDCTDNAAGTQTCTSSNQDNSATATLIPVMLGFGGDYFLSRNFALGAEFGLQGLFLVGANTNSGSSSKAVDVGGNAQFAYGALRATFVLGD
ncbi:MAG: hypothetical protein ABJB12_21845 [Pseudomonadota bacterium]